MEKDLPEDNLEAFFKKSLQEQSDEPRVDGWDTPDPNVWDTIAMTVQPEKGDDNQLLFFKWWAIAATLAFLVMIYQLHSSNQQITTLAEQVEKNSAAIKDIDNQLVKQNKDEIDNKSNNNSIAKKPATELSQNSKNTPLNQQNIDNQTPTSQTKIRITDNKTTADIISKKHLTLPDKIISNSDLGSSLNSDNIASTLPANSTAISNTEQQKISNLFPSDQQQLATDLEQNNASIDSSPIDNNSNNKLAFLPVPSRTLQTAISTLPPINPLNVTVLDTYFRPQFYIGSRAIFNASTRSLRSKDGGLDRIRRLQEQEEEHSKTTFGASVGYQFHKNWSIETGIQQGKSTIRSLHRAELQFQRNLEQVNPNNDRLESQYPLALSTSYGDVTTDISLSRAQGSAIRDGSVILIGVETSQDINYIDLPLLVKYQGQVGNFYLGARAGMSMRLIGESQVETLNIRLFPEVDFLLPKLAQRITTALDKSPNSSLNYVLGLNFEYALTNQLRLSIAPTFTRSFKPVFEKGAVETYAQTASLHAGLNYYF